LDLLQKEVVLLCNRGEKTMIKYATIGRGSIVDSYIKGAVISEKFELSAVYSRNYDTGMEYAEKWGCEKVYTTIKDLANDPEIEAVYIASPNVCHAKQTEVLLKGGKHVICEKPITTNAQEYKKLKDLADSLGLIYMEAIIPIYTENRINIKKAISEIGNINVAKIDYCQLTSRYESLMRGEQVNIFDMSLHAGTLMDLGVYCVYAAVDFFGKPNKIKASASFLKNGADACGSAIFEYDDFVCLLSYGKIGQSLAPSEIIGDKGSVLIDKIGLYSGAFKSNGDSKESLTEFVEKPMLMSKEASAFADFIKGKNLEEYHKNSALCYDVHTCMDLIKQSAEIKYPL
jgi:predicted dehydrogenase